MIDTNWNGNYISIENQLSPIDIKLVFFVNINNTENV